MESNRAISKKYTVTITDKSGTNTTMVKYETALSARRQADITHNNIGLYAYFTLPELDKAILQEREEYKINAQQIIHFLVRYHIH